MRILVLITSLIVFILLRYNQTYGFDENEIIAKPQSCTCPPWETKTGEDKVCKKLIQKGYKTDSIACHEFYFSGKDVGDFNRYGYSNYRVKFEIDSISLNVNSNKKYCAVLKVLAWKHVSTFGGWFYTFGIWMISILLFLDLFKLIRRFLGIKSPKGTSVYGYRRGD